VGVMRSASRFTQRQHRATPEVEDRALALVDGTDAQDREPRRLAVAARAAVTERDDLRRGAEGVADPGGAQQHEATIEEVRHHALCRKGRLADRDVADEGGMCRQLAVWQNAGGECRIERQAEAIADDRLVEGSVAAGQGEPRRGIEDLAALYILVERA